MVGGYFSHCRPLAAARVTFISSPRVSEPSVVTQLPAIIILLIIDFK